MPRLLKCTALVYRTDGTPLYQCGRDTEEGSNWCKDHSKPVKVILFKPSGKYYTEEEWRIPLDSIGPYDMDRSPDFRRIDGGPVLVNAQEPWGFPHLFPAIKETS